MARKSRKTRSAQEAMFPGDDTNQHVTSIKCSQGNDGNYECKIKNSNGVTTIEDNIQTFEMFDVEESYIESDDSIEWDVWYAELSHKCDIHRQGGGDTISCGKR